MVVLDMIERDCEGFKLRGFYEIKAEIRHSSLRRMKIAMSMF